MKKVRLFGLAFFMFSVERNQTNVW